MTKAYQVTLGDYLAAGADSFTAFKEGKNLIGAGIDIDAFKRYIMSATPVSPPPIDRIRMIEQ
jgi:5'-nucleotidase